MAKVSKTKSREEKMAHIVSGMADAAVKQNQRDKNLARVIIEAEFEIDSVEISDVLDDVRAAVEQLLCNGGFVTKAKLSLPATEIDFT